jgi:serine/threonine protein kinase
VFDDGKRHQMLRELTALQHNLAPLNSLAYAPSASPPNRLSHRRADNSSAASSSGGGGDGSREEKPAEEEEEEAEEEERRRFREPTCPCMVTFYDAFMDPKVGPRSAFTRLPIAFTPPPPLAAFPSLAAHPPQEGSISLVVEYMDGGSLQDIVDTGGCCDEASATGHSQASLSCTAKGRSTETLR